MHRSGGWSAVTYSVPKHCFTFQSGVPPTDFLRRISAELDRAGEKLSKLQQDLSTILTEAHVSPKSMKDLQALDETTQILQDLSRAVRLADPANASDAWEKDTELSMIIRLGDLRERLFEDSEKASTEPVDPKGEVNLF